VAPPKSKRLSLQGKASWATRGSPTEFGPVTADHRPLVIYDLQPGLAAGPRSNGEAGPVANKGLASITSRTTSNPIARI